MSEILIRRYHPVLYKIARSYNISLDEALVFILIEVEDFATAGYRRNA